MPNLGCCFGGVAKVGFNFECPVSGQGSGHISLAHQKRCSLNGVKSIQNLAAGFPEIFVYVVISSDYLDRVATPILAFRVRRNSCCVSITTLCVRSRIVSREAESRVCRVDMAV